jgi:MFS family permease
MISFDSKVSEFHYNELLKVKNSTMNTTDDITRTTLADIKKRQVYKPLIIFIFLFLLQQCAGGYVLIFYTLNIFRNLGADVLNTIDEKLALVLVGSIRLVMAIVAAILAQRCQRKVLLYISTIGMGIFAIIAGSQMTSVESSSLFIKRENASVSITQHVSGDEMSNYILIFSIFLYMLFASVGILIIPWILTSELFSIRHKAKFGGFCVAFAYIIMSIILKFFPFALEYFSLPIIFTFFGIVSIITAIFVFIFIPETHQKTFAEIEQNFLNSK